MKITHAPAQVIEIAETLRLFVQPGDVGEIRAFQNRTPKGGCYFDASQIDEAAKHAARFNANAGVFLIMNRIKPELKERPRLETVFELTKDEDISNRCHVLIDMDPHSPDRGADDASTDAEKELARLKMVTVDCWLSERGWSAPIVADSGNGWHLLFAIDLPNDEQSHRLIQNFLIALAKRFSDDQVAVDVSVHNASRVTKCYGTIARKGKNRKDRPHRLSRLVSVPDGRGIVSAELIAEATAAALAEATPATADGSLFDRPATATPRNGDAHTTTTPKLILPETFPVGGRHDTLLKVAGAVRSFGSTESEILDILRTFNRTRCGNAKPDDELQKIARDFAVKDCNLTMKALVECQSSAGSIAPPFGLDLITSETFNATSYRQHFLIKRILVEGQPCVLGGPKKTLKTSLLVDLALSLGTGTPFLSHEQFLVPDPVNVVLLSGESGGYTLQETARRIALARGRVLSTARVFWGFKLPQLGNPMHLDELAKQIRANDIKVAIIDPAYLCLLAAGESINITSNVFGMGRLLNGISEVVRDTSCTPVIAHHTRKPDRANPFGVPDLDDLSGSGFAEWPRQWLLLNRREAYQADGEHRLWLAGGGSAGHGGTWALDIFEGMIDEHGIGRTWSVSVQPASTANEQRETAKLEEKLEREERQNNLTRNADCEKLLKVYRKLPHGDTAKGVREAARLNPTRFTPANNKLLDDGLIEACRIKKHTRNEDAFRLRRSDAGTGGTAGTLPEQIPPVPAVCVVVEHPPM